MSLYFKNLWRNIALSKMRIGTHDGRFHCD